ncbi:S-adenosylmethionine-dependent methyltransferase [Mariprofundus micogutta]|uniref:S-adenosylmethionine-dependent methyltransferase n=1 Tax=Mariprofundus micogutta TaxID=1921010 RepID=A0A1L8CL08_9PROT|nr:methyltransferase domain-containing protein [Mariprofundus micogutta]GAV19597.1 S-adenosylmethionine-dependent methyltransferase [Mariprofundus micogutta]
MLLIQSDRNFDDLSERFARNIYGSAKGEVRLAIVWEHLLQTLPQLSEGKPLRILDAGCGLGQMGLKLAEMGHEVVLSDLSEKMLEETRTLFKEKRPELEPVMIHASVQNLDSEMHGQFDLILFHAVLEWLAEPKQTLQHLLRFIRPDGFLSLMFYNRDALVFRNLIRGNWRKAESDKLQGEEGGLTPYYPLTLEEVQGWLMEWDCPVLSRAGVRVVFDYMDRKMREARDVEEVVRIEMKYARKEPYLHMGRYLHLIVSNASK